jgi:O-antigen/teichoic acid export membrane protein
MYNAAAGAIRIALALLTVPLLIRCLGLEEYGLWALVSAILGLVTLAEGGLSTATTVFVAQDLAKDSHDELAQTLTVSFSLMLGLATATACGMQFGAATIVQHLLKLPPTQHQNAIHALQLVGWVVWTRLLQQVLIGIEQAHQRYGLLNLLNTIQWIGLSLGLFVIAWRGGHTPELMLWQLLAGVVSLLAHGWVVFNLLKNRTLRYAWNPVKAIALFHQSWMTWVTTLGGALFVRGDRIIIGSQLGTEALGIYSAITDVTGAINLFSALPVQPLLPLLNQAKMQFNQANVESDQLIHQAQIQTQIQQAIRLNVSVALGLGLILSMFGSWIMALFIGRSLQPEIINSFQIAVLIYALFSLNAVGYYVLLGIAVKWGMVVSILSGMFSLGCIAIGSHYGGVNGAVIGNVAYVISCSMLIVALHKLRLNPTLWIRTALFPLVWFFTCFGIGNLMPNELFVRVIFSIIAIAVLAYWFTTANQLNLKSWVAKVAV